MQKKLIALAIAGLASTAAFAQSNVTVYGVVDYGYVNRGSANGAATERGNRSEFASGIESGSRIGFKGAEDLGNGLKAIFEVEYGITVDYGNASSGTSTTGGSTANPFWNRHSYIGLTGGFGTVVGGRVDGDRYSVINSYDPFGGGTVANAVTAFGGGQVTRGDNAIAYISPDLSGFRILTFYTTQLVGNEGVGSATTTPVQEQNYSDLHGGGLNVEYSNGPIRATVNYEKFEKKNISNAGVKVGEIAGSYDFGVVKVSALYDQVKNDDTTTGDYRNYLVGISAPVGGAGLVRAVYTRHENRNDSNTDYNKYGIGYQYKLSKRTDVFTDYGHISNSSAGLGQIGFSGVAGAADYIQTAGSTSYGTRGFDVGIHHSF